MSGIRGAFSNKLGFILATSASAVGIGNLVGFPVMAAKNGGGAFLLIYVLFIALVLYPLMLMEITMGRAGQRNPVGTFNNLSGGSKLWRALAHLAVITPFMISVFYSVITVWILIYTVQSFMGNLDYLAQPSSFGAIVSSIQVFYYWIPLIALMYIVLSAGVKGGVELASRILMPALAIMLMVLAIFVLSLDNAVVGARFFLIPDFSKINSQVINSAINHGFFSLGIAMGILITYGSYFERKESTVGVSKVVSLTDTGISVLAGLLVIPAVFVANPQVNPDDLTTSSVGLMFNYLPQIFLNLQTFFSYSTVCLIAGSFFLLVLFAAFTSLISISEIPLSWIVDETSLNRKQGLIVQMLVLFVFVVVAATSFGLSDFFTSFLHYGGVEKSLFDVILDIFYETILPLVGFVTCLFCVYRWGLHKLAEEANYGEPGFIDSFLFRYLNFSMGLIIPIILAIVFVGTVGRIYFGVDLFV